MISSIEKNHFIFISRAIPTIRKIGSPQEIICCMPTAVSTLLFVVHLRFGVYKMKAKHLGVAPEKGNTGSKFQLRGFGAWLEYKGVAEAH